MKFPHGIALAALVLCSLAACKFPGFGKGGSAPPTGQVVAKVGDKEITLRQLRAELPADASSGGVSSKAVEQAALRNMVARTVLAQAARDQGLDKTPDFELQRQRLTEGLLVQALQQKIVSQMPAVTREDAEAFVKSHPDSFAERKIFTVDQIQMRRPTDPSILKGLEPLKTLDQIVAFLTAHNIPFGRAEGKLDAASVDPRVIDQILKLPPDEVFVIPSSDHVTVNQIRDTKVEPFSGPAAVDFALKALTRVRTGDAVQREFGQIAAKAAPSIHFNKDYGPPNLVGGAPADNTRPAHGGTPAGRTGAAKPPAK